MHVLENEHANFHTQKKKKKSQNDRYMKLNHQFQWEGEKKDTHQAK